MRQAFAIAIAGLVAASTVALSGISAAGTRPPGAGARTSALEAARAVPQRVVSAWARNDAEAFGSVWTPGGDLVVGDGTHLVGRRAITAYMKTGFAGPLKGARATATVKRARLLSPTVGVVQTTGGILMPGETRVPPERLGIQTWVVTKHGSRWLISAYQNTRNALEGRLPPRDERDRAPYDPDIHLASSEAKEHPPGNTMRSTLGEVCLRERLGPPQPVGASEGTLPGSRYAKGEPMSNVETVQQIYEAFGRGDIPAILERLAEDVRWEHHSTGNTAQDHDVPYMRPRSGREAAAGFFQDIEEDFEMHTFNPHSFLEGDGLVAAVIEYDLTVKATGKRVRDEEIHLMEFGSDGKMTAFRHFLDTAKAIEAHS